MWKRVVPIIGTILVACETFALPCFANSNRWVLVFADEVKTTMFDTQSRDAL